MAKVTIASLATHLHFSSSLQRSIVYGFHWPVLGVPEDDVCLSLSCSKLRVCFQGYNITFTVTVIVVAENEHTNQVEYVLLPKNLKQWEIKGEMK